MAEVVTVPISSEEDLKDFCRDHRGSLKYMKDKENIKAKYKNLVQDGVYTFFGTFYRANEDDSRRRQVDDKVLEFKSALAVKNVLGENVHIHAYVQFYDKDKKSTMEIDAVVHVGGGEFEEESTVDLVESAYTPQHTEVKVLADKVRKFQKLAKTNPHFKRVTKVVPVLAGRHWLPATVQAATAAKQWRVASSAAGYQVVRSMYTMVRRVVK